jgi:hypothetical protein
VDDAVDNLPVLHRDHYAARDTAHERAKGYIPATSHECARNAAWRQFASQPANDRQRQEDAGELDDIKSLVAWIPKKL